MAKLNSPEETWQKFLERNKTLVESGKYKVPRTMVEIDHFNSNNDNKYLYIITCADSRVHIEEIFGMQKGEAVVYRVAGGRIMGEAPDAYRGDIFRSLGVMTGIAPAGLIVLLQHQDCGGMHRTEAKAKEILSRRNPGAAEEFDDMVYGVFKDIGIDENLRRDVEKIRNWPFIGDTKVLGYAFNDEDGSVRCVTGESKI